ncbi:hypothetical protein LNA02_05260 [Levilactobacillus namurensis]|nr:hypothetical protein LNA02_05260 [Levilactobacillus namurensis]
MTGLFKDSAFAVTQLKIDQYRVITPNTKKILVTNGGTSHMDQVIDIRLLIN